MTAALPWIAGGLLGGLASKALSAPKPVAPPPLPTRNMAADLAAEDAMRKRRGAGANELTGPGGAEATTSGGKTLLGQ